MQMFGILLCFMAKMSGERLGNASVIVWALVSTELCRVNSDPLQLCVWAVGQGRGRGGAILNYFNISIVL